MKKAALISSFIISSLLTIASPADTTVQGVRLNFTYSKSIFPESWQISPVNAWGEEIAGYEIARSSLVISSALNKYSTALLELNLKAVYFLKAMKFFNVVYGGTNSSDAVYITNNGISLGYTDKYLEQTLHHEFSSILFRNYIRFFDTTAWKKQNATNADYNDPENGAGAIRNQKSSTEIDTELCKEGFLTQYSLSSFENDMNIMAQNLFYPDKGFWSAVDGYPRIKKKVAILVSFYGKLDPKFTEEYFRKLQTQ